MDHRLFKISAVLLLLSFFFPRVRSQTSGQNQSPVIYPTEEEYIRSLRLELRWITPSYILAIAGLFFMTLAMIFLFLRGKQLHRSPGCCRGCSPGWSFCCLLPIIVILSLIIAEMVVLASPNGLYLMYLEIIITSASRSPSIGFFFVLLMIYAIAALIGLVVCILMAIQYSSGRKKRQIKAVVKLSQNFSKDPQRVFQTGNATVVHEGNKEWAVIDLGHIDDESTLGTTSSSPGSDDELEETSDNATSTHSAEESDGSMNSRFRGLY
jgi:hypothetical protein